MDAVQIQSVEATVWPSNKEKWIPQSSDSVESVSSEQAVKQSMLWRYEADKNVKNKERVKKTVEEFMQYLPLYRAALEGNWEKGKRILEKDPSAITAKITRYSETVLHIAVGKKHAIKFVEELAPLIPAESLELKEDYGKTALAVAATAGNTKAAKILVKKNPVLPQITNNRLFTPLHYAAKYGHKETFLYLLSVTRDEEPSPFAGTSGATLLNLLITADFYGIALDLLKHYPQIALHQDDKGQNPLHVLAQKPRAFASGSHLRYWQELVFHSIPVDMHYVSPEPIEGGDVENPTKHCKNCSHECSQHGFLQRIFTTFGILQQGVHTMLQNIIKHLAPGLNGIQDTKLMHKQALELLRCMCEEVTLSGAYALELLEKPLLTASRLGIHEVVTEIIETYPDLIWSRDDQQHSIFHIAVIHRHEKIFSLLYQLGSHKHPVAELKDRSENNILHLAGSLGPSTRFSGAALHMQRELQWFKEVEKLVQPSFRERMNSDKMTPRMVFSAEHEELVRRGEEWMKYTASSCTVVAALIATVVFSAAFTVPGNYNNEGIPNFLTKPSFLVFAITDAVALFSSSTSLLMFLGILTSRYSEEDFLESLPKKLIIGLITLFISMASMMLAFSAGLYIILCHRLNWVVLPLSLLASVPVTLFALLQFPLLLEIGCSTYGRSIFHPQNQDRIHF